jgi:hypothetical protein
MTEHPIASSREVRASRLPRSLARLICLAGVSTFLLHPGDAFSIARTPDPPADVASSSNTKPLDTVTVEAHRQLQRDVDHFVSSVIVQYLNDSLSRWDEPICPLVAGLDRERAEFILGRISTVAMNAGAPLAGEHCRSPNFYVVVTPEPDRLVKKWFARNPSMFDRSGGWVGISRYLHSPYPVRCWYNRQFLNSDGTTVSSDTLASGFSGLSIGVATSRPAMGTHISYFAVQGLSSVIIVVDAGQMVTLNIGQLADYVAMVGLAEIRLGANTGSVPTILRLFSETENTPQGLSEWDRSLLYSLYSTRQASLMQAGAIKASMVKRIEAH